MMDFTRPDPTATCNPRHLAKQIADAIGKPVICDIDKATVVIYEDVTGFESQVQAVIDAYVYDPHFEETQEQTRVRTSYDVLKQWALDAQATYDDWPNKIAVQKDGVQREVIRRLGVFFNRFADLLKVQGFDE